MAGEIIFYQLLFSIPGGKRQDNLNVVDAFKAKDYQYLSSPGDLSSIQKNRVLGLSLSRRGIRDLFCLPKMRIPVLQGIKMMLLP